MAAPTQEEQQVIALFNNLSPEGQKLVMLELARTDAAGWKRNQQQGADHLRRVAAERVLDWDRLTDQQRQDFVCEHLEGAAE